MDTKIIDERFEITKEFVHKFRKELIISSGVLYEESGRGAYDDYVYLFNKCSDDMLIGDRLAGMLEEDNDDPYERMYKTIKGEMSIVDHLKIILGIIIADEDIIEEILEKIQDRIDEN